MCCIVKELLSAYLHMAFNFNFFFSGLLSFKEEAMREDDRNESDDG